MSTANSDVLDRPMSYPVFQANQILSDDDLTSVVDYFQQQTQLTRLCLIGAGNVCGLIPRWDGVQLIISKGYGVTSDGFLIQVDKQETVQIRDKNGAAQRLCRG